jgi:hypothetical protein
MWPEIPGSRPEADVEKKPRSVKLKYLDFER